MVPAPIQSAADDDRLDSVFHALSNRSRRALLAHLARGPAAVTALAQPLAMSLNAVSKHIKVLERAGLISRAVDGRVHRCSLDAHALREVRRWVDHYRVFWDDALAAIARYVEDGDPNER